MPSPDEGVAPVSTNFGIDSVHRSCTVTASGISAPRHVMSRNRVSHHKALVRIAVEALELEDG